MSQLKLLFKSYRTKTYSLNDITEHRYNSFCNKIYYATREGLICNMLKKDIIIRVGEVYISLMDTYILRHI